MKWILSLLFALNVLIVPTVFAHQPVLEPDNAGTLTKNGGLYFGSVRLADPTQASLAVYGTILKPDEYDLYAFVAGEDGTVPVKLLVPVRSRNDNFKPSLIVIAKEVADSVALQAPFEIPDGYLAREVVSEMRDRKFFEPFSAERYYDAAEVQLQVRKNNNYFIAVLERNGQRGDYTLGIGTKENFSNVSTPDLLKRVLSVKLGLFGAAEVIPWKDMLGLFLLLAGFIIGLGAVTVIDVHGFFARHSAYWTSTTIRAHHITKPLIWFGILLVITGGSIFYRNSWLNGVILFQALLITALIINGLFLTFVISPRLQKKEAAGLEEELLSTRMRNAIALSFMVSFVGWWGSVALLVWHLIMQR